MIKSTSAAVAISLMAGACPLRVRAQDAASLPFAARVESVIERGSVEGFEVSVVHLSSELSPTEAASIASRVWRSNGIHHVIETSSADWRIVSKWEAGTYRTLQLRPAPNGGSAGFVSLWRSMAQPSATGFDPMQVLPAGAQVLRRFASVDAGRRAASVVARVDASPAWLLDSLEVNIIRAGHIRQSMASTPPSVVEGMARHYRGGGREVLVTVHPHLGRTGLVVHVTEATP